MSFLKPSVYPTLLPAFPVVTASAGRNCFRLLRKPWHRRKKMGGGYPKDLDPTSEWFGHIVRSHQDVYTDAAHMLHSYFGLGETLGTDQGFAGSSLPPSKDAGAVARRW